MQGINSMTRLRIPSIPSILVIDHEFNRDDDPMKGMNSNAVARISLIPSILVN